MIGASDFKVKALRFKAVKGMQDIFPQESRRWVTLENIARRLGERYGYGEIRIPVLEPTRLFVRSIGENTDIVEKEMFTFTDAGKKSLTLRPEGTAGVVRAYLEKKIYVQRPLAKYFYLGPMFRRERPQAGRRRQFHQFGIEALGSLNPALDVETIDLLLFYLEEVGLKEWELGLNSVGCPECRPNYQKKLKLYLKEKQGSLCDHCKKRLEKNVLRILDCRNPRCQEIVSSAPVPSEFLCSDCHSHFETVKGLLSDLSLPFIFRPFLVRGLDYYTRTVFEVYCASLGAQDAVAAGGRYDNLIEDLGGPSLGAVGFSIGLERLLLGLGQRDIMVPAEAKVSVYCVSLNEIAFNLNFVLLSRLRREGIRGDIDYGSRSIKAQMREANKLKMDFALIRGDEEVEKGAVKVKDMKSGEEKLVPEKEVLSMV